MIVGLNVHRDLLRFIKDGREGGEGGAEGGWGRGGGQVPM